MKTSKNPLFWASVAMGVGCIVLFCLILRGRPDYPLTVSSGAERLELNAASPVVRSMAARLRIQQVEARSWEVQYFDGTKWERIVSRDRSHLSAQLSLLAVLTRMLSIDSSFGGER